MAPPDDKYYCEPSPDYLKFVDLGGGGLTPVGYGFRSIEYVVRNICRAIDASDGLSEADALAKRRELIKRYDEEGIMATPRTAATTNWSWRPAGFRSKTAAARWRSPTAPMRAFP